MQLPLGNSFSILGVDQSLSGTGLYELKIRDGEVDMASSTGRVTKTKETGMSRLGYLVQETLDAYRTMVESKLSCYVAMEQPTMMATSASVTPLIELAGLLKYALWKEGALIRIQNQSTMKKFIFGKGDKKKDSGYLIEVMDATGQRFSNDNIADAFCHAYTLAMTILVLTGKRNVNQFGKKQAEALLSGARSLSGLTDSKFEKLSEQEKLGLMSQSLETLS